MSPFDLDIELQCTGNLPLYTGNDLDSRTITHNKEKDNYRTQGYLYANKNNH